VDFIRSRIPRPAASPRASAVVLSSIASELCEHVLAEDVNNEQGLGCDNMTVLIVDLRQGHVAEPASSQHTSSQLAEDMQIGSPKTPLKKRKLGP
jgi:hypothetical protein